MQEWAAILGRDKVGSHGKVRKPGIQLRDFGRAGGGWFLSRDKYEPW